MLSFGCLVFSFSFHYSSVFLFNDKLLMHIMYKQECVRETPLDVVPFCWGSFRPILIAKFSFLFVCLEGLLYATY